MKLEQQVTNLEISKKLKDLGYKQEGLFWWVKNDCSNENYKDYIQKDWFISEEDVEDAMYWQEERFVAPTASELLHFMPPDIGVQKLLTNKYGSCMLSDEDGNTHWDEKFEDDEFLYEVFNEDTPANALGKMAIYLLKNKLMEVKE